MEQHEQEEQKPIENWNGEERRRGDGQGNYEGDDRRKAEAMERMPGGNPQGGNPGMGDSDADEQEGR
jgi:hypothetical protein